MLCLISQAVIAGLDMQSSSSNRVGPVFLCFETAVYNWSKAVRRTTNVIHPTLVLCSHITTNKLYCPCSRQGDTMNQARKIFPVVLLSYNIILALHV